MRRKSFTKTYEIKHGPEPEDFWSYAYRITIDLVALLDSGPEEIAVQRFLEQNPCLVPGLRSPGTFPTSAFPQRSMLISQPSLPGLRERVPDFMWISDTSAAVQPTLIEIESPNKRLFTARRVPSAEFTQARHQLTQWRAWFSRPENKQKFITEYAVTPFFSLKPRFILVCGRRAEFENDSELARERAFLLDGEVESLMSYDRLAPDPILSNAITVKATRSGRFRAIAVPPTFTLGPVDAERLNVVDGIRDVLETTSSIQPERRDFLLERLPYWQAWAQADGDGVVASGDRE